MTSYHFIIVDDHPLFRDALRLSLSGMFEGLEIGEAVGLDDVVGKLNARPETDLVLLDLYMPGVQGFSGLMYLRAQFPDIPVVIVSANEEPQVMRRSLDFGASGYIPKSLGVDEIRMAVKQVLDGQIWTPPDLDLSIEQPSEDSEIAARLATLTPQQVRVLMMLSQGLLNKQIAYELSVSEATVKAHVSAILQKLGVDSRTQAVIAAHRIDSGQWQGLTGE
ncbi:MAG TPA: response regulator transcription factor [Rhizobiales bacterium]|nr:response regulator transcription factor [Hyphomicrobiales bacterium]